MNRVFTNANINLQHTENIFITLNSLADFEIKQRVLYNDTGPPHQILVQRPKGLIKLLLTTLSMNLHSFEWESGDGCPKKLNAVKDQFNPKVFHVYQKYRKGDTFNRVK